MYTNLFSNCNQLLTQPLINFIAPLPHSPIIRRPYGIVVLYYTTALLSLRPTTSLSLIHNITLSSFFAALSHCLTSSHYHCPTASLSHCPTASLSHCHTATLSHCSTASLSHCPTATLSHCSIVPHRPTGSASV
jgi:hypothetical protein